VTDWTPRIPGRQLADPDSRPRRRHPRPLRRPPTPPLTTGIDWSGGSANDIKSGGAGADSLSGNGGADKLSGLAGNDDVLQGGSGNDFLIGGDRERPPDGRRRQRHLQVRDGRRPRHVWGFAAHTYSGAERDHFDVSSLGIHQSDYSSAIHLTNTSAGVVISAGDMDMLVHGMSASSFSAADFIFA
jgi:Ca2+-binding RTX toxin-like protein